MAPKRVDAIIVNNIKYSMILRVFRFLICLPHFLSSINILAIITRDNNCFCNYYVKSFTKTYIKQMSNFPRDDKA